MRRSITIISLLVAMAILFTAMPATARSRIALGISNPDGNSINGVVKVVEEHKARYGQYPSTFSLWSNWGSRGQAPQGAVPKTCTFGNGNCYFPRDQVDYLMSKNITPIIWWQYTNPGRPSQGLFSRYKLIASTATHNAYIKRWAAELRAASLRHNKRPIGVRFGHEAQGPWFPWAIGRFDNTAQNYKAAWRKLHNLFKTTGPRATNARKYALFIWSQYVPRKGTYPGDKYIDYIGFTALNFGWHQKKQNGRLVWKNAWRSMQSIVDRSVKAAKSFSKRPIIVIEVASNHRKKSKANWLKAGYLSAYRKHPRIKGIVYLDSNQPNLTGKGHPDWQLINPANGSAVKAYRQLVNRKDKIFAGKLQYVR